MEKLTKETKQIMEERFGKDNVIALATVGEGVLFSQGKRYHIDFME